MIVHQLNFFIQTSESKAILLSFKRIFHSNSGLFIEIKNLLSNNLTKYFYPKFLNIFENTNFYVNRQFEFYKIKQHSKQIRVHNANKLHNMLYRLDTYTIQNV